MNYTQAIDSLYRLERRGIKLEVSRVRAALDALGSPDEAYPTVHVAGTNGKGSTCAMLEACLRATGERTGLFTSPHLHRFVERISVNGAPVSESAFVDCTERVLSLEGRLQLGLSFFECAFLIACEVFREEKCGWVVLETGLGGRLDATNTVTPLISVITEIALDHTKILGETLEAITFEKAGIIKPGVPVVSGASDARAQAVIAERATQLKAPLLQRAIPPQPLFAVASDQRLGLFGEHQRLNASLALATLRQLSVDGHLASNEEAYKQGLEKVSWPGRIERLAGEPSWIVDAAHNPEGCKALALYLRTLTKKPRALLFGAMADKEHAAMLDALRPAVEQVILTKPPVDRGASPEELEGLEEDLRITDWREAVQVAQRLAGPGDSLVACGSIFLIAAVRAAHLGLPSDPAIRM